MRTRRRTLIPSHVEFGASTAGHCSVCHRPFELQIGGAETLSAANERLRGMFDAHVCDEDSSQAALRLARGQLSTSSPPQPLLHCQKISYFKRTARGSSLS